MKLNFSNKLKVFLIVVLVILVAGMAMFGFLGLNQTIDYKSSYELQVSLDQNIDDVKATFTDATVSAMNANGVKFSDFSMQEMNDGFVLIYKLNAKVEDATKIAIQDSVNNALETHDIQAEVKVYENLGSYDSQAGYIAIALAIAVVVTFAYSLIMNKLSGGVAVLCSSVLSAILFVALMGLTRIPAQPYFMILLSASVALALAISLVIVSRYKAFLKADDKSTAKDAVENVNKSLFKVYIAIAVCVLLSAVIAGAIGGLSTICLGLGILVAGIAGIASSVYMTPFIFSLIKGRK